MNPKIPIDLMIFDFDGTLTDSIPPAVEAIQTMLAELGLPYKSKEEINRHVGYGEIPLISGSIGSDDPKLVNEAMELYFKYYIAKMKNIPLYPHVKEMLEHFKNKIKIIVSNKRDEFIRIILNHHGLTGEFTEILGGDTAACLKPDPCTILALLDKYKTPNERALFIGDMTVDIETGKNAGIHTCGVSYGFGKREDIEKAAPDFVIDDMIKLKELME